MRDYAKAVGLDSDEVVDEFCRLFPIGDRRANRIIKAQAELIGHDPSVIETQPVLLPPEGERRSAAREHRAEVRARRFKFAPRTVAAAIDLGCAVSLAAWGPMLLGTSFWAAAGVTALFYYGVSTIVLGATPVYGQHRGIFWVEVGVAVTVSGVMLKIFYMFAGRGRDE